jgi:hypothetical protein
MSIVASLWNILVARRLQVEVTFLEPVPTAGDRNRHHVAEAAAERVAAWLGVPTPSGRRLDRAVSPAAGTADSAPGQVGDSATPAP